MRPDASIPKEGCERGAGRPTVPAVARRKGARGVRGSAMPIGNMLRRLAAAGTILSGLLTASVAAAADQAMIDAARREGQVTWYTTQIVNQLVRPVAEAFEKKYGVRVNYIRADAPEVILRVMNKAKAGRVEADVVDGIPTSAALKKHGLVMKWTPESAQRLPKDFVDQEGYWVATNLYVLTPGYNTSLVPKGSEPKSLQDLLDPKWAGRIAWGSANSSSSAPGFIGLILTEMGEEKGMAFLREFSKQKVANLGVAARQVLDQVIAGEYSLALQIYNNHAVISAAQGAPSAWIALQPAFVVMGVMSVTKDAPHPNAGKLLIDFLVSEEGQQIFRNRDYLPVDPNIPPKDKSLRPDGTDWRYIAFTPEQADAAMPKWASIYKELFQ